MTMKPRMTPLALAAISAVGTAALLAVPQPVQAGKTAGKYLAGDFHNHSTCSDGAVSLQKKVKKSMDRTAETPWGLDWFVQAGHGGSGNRNCTLPEDATFATPAYPATTQGPFTTWQTTTPAIQPKGNASGTSPNQQMWRWQAVQEYQYPLMEYLAAVRNEPLFIGVESVVAGHEHTSMGVITGQIPPSTFTTPLPSTAGYTAQGNANALAMWQYCFDRGNSDLSRGNATTQPGNVNTGIGNNWDCTVPGSLNSGDPIWNDAAKKLVPTGTTQGTTGHNKTVESLKWMKQFHGEASYYVPAHLERAGPFNPGGNNGFNIEHLRNFNNAAPRVAFGFESQPGHGASDRRGEYNLRRNTISGVNVDSVGGTTYGGTGVYAAAVGGVWDALLGEGRNFWFFASSDWHNRGSFGPDDRRTTQDFLPGEYQRNYTMVRNGGARTTPQHIVDGLRTGNNFAASGQLIDRLAFVACASYAGPAARSNAAVEALALAAAQRNTDTDQAGCATMGEKLVVRPGADIVVAIVARDPSGKSFSPYSFANPSLLQIGVTQPLDMPVLDHIDVVRGLVTGYKAPGSANYAGAWPTNAGWLDSNPASATFGQAQPLSVVPAATRNDSAAVIKTFNKTGWVDAGGDLLKMSLRIPAVTASQYVRLRGSNLPANVPYETDASGNPLADIVTNAGNTANLRIPCEVAAPAGVAPTEFNRCPTHLASSTSTLPNVNGAMAGRKAVSYDVAAWADLWFYSNPIYLQVTGSTVVAGVR